MKMFLSILVASFGFLEAIAQIPSPAFPQVLLPSIVSTGYNERDLAISPDGTEMFYTIQAPRNSTSVVVRRLLRDKDWGEAESAPFSGQYSDLEPAFSQDGRRLFFVSNRPLSADGKTKDYDIWYVNKTETGWSQPMNAGNQINSSVDEYYPSVTSDGSVYFTAQRADALGKEDIYKSHWTKDHFELPINIGPGVNSPLDEFNAFVDPAERYIIYGVESGESDLGRGDLYISYRNTDGSWTKAQNLGPNINSKRLDYCPYVYKGIFYFTSERVAPIGTDNKKLSLKEIKTALDSWGNGWGDVYFLPVDQVVH